MQAFSPDGHLLAQTFSVTSACGCVRQGSDCTHTAQVICEQRSVEIDGLVHYSGCSNS